MIKLLRPTKAEINELPPFDGLPMRSITLVNNETALKLATQALAKADCLGFDTESKPTFRPGERSDGPHLIQLATANRAFLFPATYPAGVELVLEILQSPLVKKVGFGLSGDRTLFRKKYQANLSHLVDLSVTLKTAAKLKQPIGAQASVAMLLGHRLSKKGQTSNWAAPVLKEYQLQYAANDAYAAYCVNQAMEQRAAQVREGN